MALLAPGYKGSGVNTVSVLGVGDSFLASITQQMVVTETMTAQENYHTHIQYSSNRVHRSYLI